MKIVTLVSGPFQSQTLIELCDGPVLLGDTNDAKWIEALEKEGRWIVGRLFSEGPPEADRFQYYPEDDPRILVDAFALSQLEVIGFEEIEFVLARECSDEDLDELVRELFSTSFEGGIILDSSKLEDYQKKAKLIEAIFGEESSWWDGSEDGY